MPLQKGKSKKVISKNIKELYADNKKSGKAKGVNGKPRSKKQIVAIAMSVAGKSKKTFNKQAYERERNKVFSLNK